MTSFWKATSPLIDTDPFDAEPTDVAIVGAGLTGLATAVMLARRGLRITVLEARTVGAAATGNTTGKISLLQGTVLSELRRHAGDDVARAYVDANRAGQQWLVSEMRALGVRVEQRDAVTYAVSEDGANRVGGELQAAATCGLDVAPMDDPGLPFTVLSAIRVPGQFQLHAMQMVAALTAEARRLGAKVIEGVRVVGVDAASPCIVHTALGELEADRVVVATGVPILDRGLFFAKVEAVRSYAAAYELAPGDARPRGMYLSADEPRRSIRTTPSESGEVLITGGGGHTTGRRTDTENEVNALDDWTSEHWPGARRTFTWSAQDHRTHTRVPYAGVMPRSGGRVYTATGYNKWGMTNAVVAAMTLSGHLGAEMPAWAHALAAGNPGAADLADSISANAEVIGHLVGDWGKVALAGTDPGTHPAEGEGRVHHEGPHPVAVSTVDGLTCRVSGVCTHLGGILAWNAVERSWDCPLHGSRFAADGTVLEGPAVHDLHPR